MAALEDAGFFCVDNLPVALLPKFLELHVQSVSEVNRFAFVMDLRERRFLSRYKAIFEELETQGYKLEIVFLEASADVLVRRFSETRRYHPLSHPDGKGILESIETEKGQLAELRRVAHRVIDTSSYNVHQLKSAVLDHAEKNLQDGRMQIKILSFGFKYGIPHDADLVVDVRFLPNPYFVWELKTLNGEQEEVKAFLMKREETQEFMRKYIDLLEFLLPLYDKEGKAYLTLAVGCTGGQHRSVTISRAVFDHLRAARKSISLTHRDLKP